MRTFFTGCCMLLALFSGAQNHIEITHFNVGQGDATLITSYVSEDSTINVLFDAGGYGKISGVDAGDIIGKYLFAKGIKRIDYLIISHYDADHIGGVVQGGYRNLYESSFTLGIDQTGNTTDDVKVVNVIDRGINDVPDSKIFERYSDFANSCNRISIDRKDKLGYQIPLGSNSKFTCIAANGFGLGQDRQVSNVDTENEYSLSFILQYKGFDYLISGDLIGRASGAEDAQVESAVGEYLKEEGINIDILHVNHHGADNTSSTEFLNIVKAEYAIISCGENNKHEHPREDSLNRLIQSGVQSILQTNQSNHELEFSEAIKAKQEIFDSHIIVSTNGSNVTINSFDHNPAHTHIFGVDE